MEDRNWKNEFLGRCEYPRLVWADGLRILISDARHAAYWDENAQVVMLAKDAEVHAMELALLPGAEELADLPGDDDADDENRSDSEADSMGDISALPLAQAKEVVEKSSDVEQLRGWLMSTGNNRLKKAIKDRLAELG